jgi:methylglyoxal synthase
MNRSVPKRKRIALVAHDHKKTELLEWATHYRGELDQHELYATGTTGHLLHDALGLQVHRYLSGPLGGDLQIGAAIAEQRIDILIFFWDPLTAQPHDPDVRALIRAAVVWDVPVACNRATADYVLRSPKLQEEYPSPLPASLS